MTTVKFIGWLFETPEFRSALEAAVSSVAPDLPDYPEARSRIRTGRMAASWNSDARGLQLRVGSDGVLYTIFHNEGTRYIEAQPMLTETVSVPTFVTLLANAIAKEVSKL